MSLGALHRSRFVEKDLAKVGDLGVGRNLKIPKLDLVMPEHGL